MTVKAIRRDGLPAQFRPLEIEKSNLLIRAKLALGYEKFLEAADLFLEVAKIERQLAKMAEANGRLEKATTHYISEMSCWANAGDTIKAIQCGEYLLTKPFLTERQREFVMEFVLQSTELRIERARSAYERSLELAL